MLKKILQTKNQIPISLPKHASFKPRNSRKNQIQSTNSISLTSFQNIGPQNQDIKNLKQQFITSQLNFSKNFATKQNKKESQISQRQNLQEKMQNVSCLYSNYIYKNSQKNFVDDMKLQRYRIIIQNQRIEKNQLLKQIQQMKEKINLSQKQKQTVMFAYRALQAKIKQKQKYMRSKLNSKQKKAKLSINIINANQNSIDVTSQLSMYQQQLRKNREILTSQGILTVNQDQSSQQIFKSFSKFCSSQSICKYLQNQNGLKQWQEKQKRFNQMQLQIKELNEKLFKQEQQYKIIQKENQDFLSQITFYKQEYGKMTSQLFDHQQKIAINKKTIMNLQTQLMNTQTKYNEMNLKFIDQQKQALRKEEIIKELQDTKYTYLMREEKERQQMQLLRKFTQNLQLNDQKINQFIKVTFDNELQHTSHSQSKLYKQDISYILHLIKKKQNIYNQLVKQYQQKHRQTETRCFLLQKKLHLSDMFIKKLQDFIIKSQQKGQKQDNESFTKPLINKKEGNNQKQIVSNTNQNQKVTLKLDNTIKKSQGINSNSKQNSSHTSQNMEKAEQVLGNTYNSNNSNFSTGAIGNLNLNIQELKSIIEGYKLDKRIF